MRLAAVPIACHRDPDNALDVAYRQSKTTHQGEEAAELCKLMTHIIIHAMNQETRGSKQFLDELPIEFLQEPSVQYLALSRQEGTDPDRNWNWKDPHFRYSATRELQNSGYMGSYAMDGMAMALHCVYTTSSFSEALLKCVNIGGDADSVGSVVGQIAGAIYGISSVPPEWIDAVQKWDGGGSIAMRAHVLFHAKYP
jgi:ADP-ribosyl-[dinitrogen reductase] hydrolase